MRRTLLTVYEPAVAAPERAPLTLLSAALRVCQQVLRDEHPTIHAPPNLDAHAPLVVTTAALIESRCDELLRLLDFYDRAVDHAVPPLDDHDDDIPF
jgi:hypothetical protein